MRIRTFPDHPSAGGGQLSLSLSQPVTLAHRSATPSLSLTGIPVEKKRALFVPLRDSALLLGWLEGQLVSTILPLPEETLAAEEKVRLVGALNKVRLCAREDVGDSDRSTRFGSLFYWLLCCAVLSRLCGSRWN